MTTGTELESHFIATDLGPEAPEDRKVASKSPTQLALARFRKDKLSMVSFVIVVFYFLAALAAPFLVQAGVLNPFTTHDELLDANTLPLGGFGGISWDHPLGVEPGVGRDVLSRVWYGITFSLAISLSATLLAVIIGVVAGIVSGASGGWIDAIIGRIIDLTLAFPQTLMLLALSSVALAFITEVLGVPAGDPARALYVIVVLGLFGWTGVARIVRGQVLSLREREFVHAAQLLGASKMRLYFREILPNLWAPILVTFTLIMPAFVSAEAALAYLGVSIHPPTPTLGNILRDSLSYAQNDFVYFFSPAFLIAVIVVSFNLLGDGVRDALDPKGHQ
ncbi:peptide ABC transporter permease [Nocardioides gansuensis]|uniref:Peptide ABC transporter permease n=1 Tax=Nocardioides gansuensis TaxID=2138300 RepID=A0A2T8FAZ6_9ACTN|nr:ABC transporter permease [Nocardioides gansuensis]PVG82873.1 peptide ABC transporter permease [Nocardioides gansuensis]